uniref:Secreted protein n=1 Tax=Solanum tuberosum TaxID=4113 RepID=M1ANU0_SOLTU
MANRPLLYSFLFLYISLKLCCKNSVCLGRPVAGSSSWFKRNFNGDSISSLLFAVCLQPLNLSEALLKISVCLRRPAQVLLHGLSDPNFSPSQLFFLLVNSSMANLSAL